MFRPLLIAYFHHFLSLQVQDTFLASPRLVKDVFLRKLLSAHLQAKGQTVVIASDKKTASRVIRLFRYVSCRIDWFLSQNSFPSQNSFFSGFDLISFDAIYSVAIKINFLVIKPEERT